MNRRLQMIFRNTDGRNISISVVEPKADLQATDVESVMQNIKNANIFTTSGGDIVGLVKAQVISRDVDTIVEFA